MIKTTAKLACTFVTPLLIATLGCVSGQSPPRNAQGPDMRGEECDKFLAAPTSVDYDGWRQLRSYARDELANVQTGKYDGKRTDLVDVLTKCEQTASKLIAEVDGRDASVDKAFQAKVADARGTLKGDRLTVLNFHNSLPAQAFEASANTVKHVTDSDDWKSIPSWTFELGTAANAAGNPVACVATYVFNGERLTASVVAPEKCAAFAPTPSR